jgi:hypothetical protein
MPWSIGCAAKRLYAATCAELHEGSGKHTLYMNHSANSPFTARCITKNATQFATDIDGFLVVDTSPTFLVVESFGQNGAYSCSGLSYHIPPHLDPTGALRGSALCHPRRSVPCRRV